LRLQRATFEFSVEFTRRVVAARASHLIAKRKLRAESRAPQPRVRDVHSIRYFISLRYSMYHRKCFTPLRTSHSSYLLFHFQYKTFSIYLRILKSNYFDGTLSALNVFLNINLFNIVPICFIMLKVLGSYLKSHRICRPDSIRNTYQRVGVSQYKVDIGMYVYVLSMLYS
jgi:hypothetical protein